MLFLLSFRQRDELASLAAGAGWRVVAARRADGVQARLRTSGAAICVIDARGASEDGLAAARLLGPDIEALGGALLVLVSRDDVPRLSDFLAAGATHFAVSPLREAELMQALRYAARHVERVSGWHERGGAVIDLLGWRYDPAIGSLQLTPALATQLGLDETPPLREALQRLTRADRALLRSALRRLGETTSTAFAHELPGLGRLVEHLQRDARTGRLHALIEPLGRAPDAGAAVRDALTGVQDATSARRWIERRLGEGQPVAIALIALLRLDTVNTVYGRESGDALLRGASRRVAEAAREALGRQALVARIGGSEFLVASDSAHGMEAASAAIEAALDRPFVTGDTLTPLGSRIATAESMAGDDAAALLRRARDLLHSQKGTSFSAESLAQHVRRALDTGEIRVRFQPQVAIATNAITGVEALARWHHAELGEIGPEALFAAAEAAGLEIAVSSYVQARALALAAAWPAPLSALRLSINVTAADVARLGFADALLGRVDESGFPRERLTLEITETGLIEDLAQAARLLSELRSAGCRVAIDDFGTGYSSLAYLKALPLDYLKIDKKLAQDITGTARDRVVVRGVIEMARSLGLTVIAEGVENEAQLDQLAKEGCQYYQGFLCAEALDVPALRALVERG